MLFLVIKGESTHIIYCKFQKKKKICPHWISKNAWVLPRLLKSGESIELVGHFKDYFLLLSSKYWYKKYWLDKNGHTIGWRVVFNYIDIPNAPAPCMKCEHDNHY